jgi:hypothetical protein
MGIRFPPISATGCGDFYRWRSTGLHWDKNASWPRLLKSAREANLIRFSMTVPTVVFADIEEQLVAGL